MKSSLKSTLIFHKIASQPGQEQTFKGTLLMKGDNDYLNVSKYLLKMFI